MCLVLFFCNCTWLLLGKKITNVWFLELIIHGTCWKKINKHFILGKRVFWWSILQEGAKTTEQGSISHLLASYQSAKLDLDLWPRPSQCGNRYLLIQWHKAKLAKILPNWHMNMKKIQTKTESVSDRLTNKVLWLLKSYPCSTLRLLSRWGLFFHTMAQCGPTGLCTPHLKRTELW